MHFTFDASLVKSFIQFGYEIYRDDPFWIPPLRRDLYSQLSPDFSFYKKLLNAHKHFLVTRDGKVVGRASAMVNDDLKKEDGTTIGTVGFFECVNDFGVAQDLLDTATHWLGDEYGIRCVWGPMNFDIWHGYRFMTQGFDRSPFIGEPRNKTYYPEFFERYGFSAIQHWDSVELNGRIACEAAMGSKQKHYDEFIERGYRFEPFDSSRFIDELGKLWVVLTRSFSGFFGYTDISREQFQRLFAASRQAFESKLFRFVYDEENNLVGFTGAFLDLAHAVRSMQGKTDLLSRARFLMNRKRADRVVFYLGGMLPGGGRRRAGLGRAGFYYTMRQILDEGFENVVVALMARGNNVQGLLRDHSDAQGREYTLYELRK